MSALAALPSDVPRTRACAALGVGRHWCYPDTRQRVRAAQRTGQPRKLSAAQRQQVMDHLHSDRFCDVAPRQVYATLLSEGEVLASVSTMYRLLRAQSEAVERRAQRPPQRHAKPQLLATAPQQVWSWDITKLPTVVRGVYLSLYVILDLFSRYAVGWMVSRKENAGLARHLFERVIARHQIPAHSLIVHQDRGAPMTAHCFADLLTSLGVERSYSRPRVSNDNAFSESQFKTLKYWPSYPNRFDDAEHARAWSRDFFAAYNQRPHDGLALFSPEDVFTGQVDRLWRIRQAALDAHFERHPERYVNGRPAAKRPPAAVAINPDDGIALERLLEQPASLRAGQTPVAATLPEVVT